MPVRVVVVLDEIGTSQATVAALNKAECEAIVLADSMVALDAGKCREDRTADHMPTLLGRKAEWDCFIKDGKDQATGDQGNLWRVGRMGTSRGGTRRVYANAGGCIQNCKPRRPVVGSDDD